MTTGFHWASVDESKEQYRCCPAGEGGSHGQASAGVKNTAPAGAANVKTAPAPGSAAAAIPEGLGSSWIGQPIDLASSGWTSGAIALGILALFLLARRWLGQQQQQQPSRQSFKEH